MAHTMMKAGLIGIAIGMGFGADLKREARLDLSEADQKAVQICHQELLESAVNSYHLRTLGRAEARQTGSLIDRGSSHQAAMMSRDSRQGYSFNYRLRTLGRTAEARQTERNVFGTAEEKGDQGILAFLGSESDIYKLRALGRGEAHETGTDFCEAKLTQPERFGSGDLRSLNAVPGA